MGPFIWRFIAVRGIESILMLRTAPAVVLLALSIHLYGTHLGEHVMQPEELRLAGASTALSTSSWHDASGRFLPLFVQVSGDVWLAPVPVYATALLMKVGLPSTAEVRWTAALMGTLDVLLLYCIVIRVFRSLPLAFVSGLMVLLAPAHLTYSRLASADGIWQLPFIAVWLIGLIGFVEGPFLVRRWMLSIGVAALGASILTEPSAGLMVPWFGLATFMAVRRVPDWKWTDLRARVWSLCMRPRAPGSMVRHPSGDVSRYLGAMDDSPSASAASPRLGDRLVEFRHTRALLERLLGLLQSVEFVPTVRCLNSISRIFVRHRHAGHCRRGRSR